MQAVTGTIYTICLDSRSEVILNWPRLTGPLAWAAFDFYDRIATETEIVVTTVYMQFEDPRCQSLIKHDTPPLAKMAAAWSH